MKHLEILKYLNTTFDANFYMVGGFVRDMLSGIVSEDYDIATDITPDEIMQIAEQKNIKVIPTGLKHGTVTLLYKDKALEITTFRKDLENNGRHSKVEFTKSIKEDSIRRDFTINAIYIDSEGLIYDFHSGKQDLGKSRVRFIGEAKERIAEDYLRMLRFFRFFADFDKSGISLNDSKVKDAISANIHNIKQLSADRITQEILKTCNSKNYVKSFAGMLMFDELVDLLNLKNKTINSKDIDLINSLDPFKKLVLLYRNNLNELLANKYYNFSNNQKKYIKLVDCQVQDYLDEDNIIYFVAKYGFDVVEFKLYSLYLDSKLAKFELLDMLAKINLGVPCFEVTGADLISLGFESNKQLGTTLNQVKQYWLDNNFADKESCLDFARKFL